jgi:hypothetical protein
MTRGEPREGIYERFVRFGAGQENNVCFHSVWNGERFVTVPSYSKTDPFAKIGTEATRVEGSKPRGPVTAADIDTMRALAQRVRESYGELAVGALPSLETKQDAAA